MGTRFWSLGMFRLNWVSIITVLASWSIVLCIFTVCGALLSLCHHSAHCGFHRRSIFHNYTLRHLLDLGHHICWVPEEHTTDGASVDQLFDP